MTKRSGFGWLELVIDIALIGLGILAFADPDLALTGQDARWNYQLLLREPEKAEEKRQPHPNQPEYCLYRYYQV